VSWVHSGSALYSRDARSLRYAAWLGSAILKRRSAGILKPPGACLGLLDPTALVPLCFDRERPLTAVFHVLVSLARQWAGLGLSCRYWKKRLFGGAHCAYCGSARLLLLPATAGTAAATASVGRCRSVPLPLPLPLLLLVSAGTSGGRRSVRRTMARLDRGRVE
jgi:hypothetical protein